MTRTRSYSDAERPERTERTPSVTDSVRRFGFVHAFAGLAGLVGPAVEGNDDGLVNTEPGLFLGVVAVNGPHALFHLLWGLLGLSASRDEGSARRHALLSAVVFATLAAVGWRRFGFERGVHRIGVFAVDGWGNLGHAIVSVLGLRTAMRS
ncbi:DUF4383 domain-containing protein [Halorussus sp. MSC15.2]|uniref:DUF4383 domain-containing protein n=1 Tax=Halorussus sp. MSC15.2 TaxID=2283638 RepID=UPI0013D05A09|nr:DUF4383 domain-containing protein [Halorussus sp. MSC15.2]NEU56778.1 DUF4383 domain-containing protein [Halorussus sp. MSC15.2]